MKTPLSCYYMMMALLTLQFIMEALFSLHHLMLKLYAGNFWWWHYSILNPKMLRHTLCRIKRTTTVKYDLWRFVQTVHVLCIRPHVRRTWLFACDTVALLQYDRWYNHCLSHDIWKWTVSHPHSSVVPTCEWAELSGLLCIMWRNIASVEKYFVNEK